MRHDCPNQKARSSSPVLVPLFPNFTASHTKFNNDLIRFVRHFSIRYKCLCGSASTITLYASTVRPLIYAFDPSSNQCHCPLIPLLRVMDLLRPVEMVTASSSCSSYYERFRLLLHSSCCHIALPEPAPTRVIPLLAPRPL